MNWGFDADHLFESLYNALVDLRLTRLFGLTSLSQVAVVDITDCCARPTVVRAEVIPISKLIVQKVCA